MTPADPENNPKPFDSPVASTWCPGCGNFGIWVSLKNALTQLGLAPEQVVIVYGIGCSGNMTNLVRAYGFHALHGRAVPVAEAVKLINHDLTVIVVAGDGDSYGEGLNHFISACRANHDITYLVHDNRTYSLTTGQTSPTSDPGYVTKSTPAGNPDRPLNPLSLALSAGASFVSRGFSGEPRHLVELIKAAIQHRGFSLVNVFQPCVTFNKVNTFKWFSERVFKLEAPQTIDQAWLTSRAADRLPIGVLYQETRPAYHEQIEFLKNGPLADQPVESRDITDLLEKFR